ncbi:hypothetical protein RFI_06767, partial [Reticulomyxa filosa]
NKSKNKNKNKNKNKDKSKNKKNKNKMTETKQMKKNKKNKKKRKNGKKSGRSTVIHNIDYDQEENNDAENAPESDPEDANEGYYEEYNDEEYEQMEYEDNNNNVEYEDDNEYMIADGVSAIDQIIGIWNIRYEDGTSYQSLLSIKIITYKFFFIMLCLWKTDSTVDRLPENAHGWEGKVRIAYDPEVDQYAIECENVPSVYEFVTLIGPNEIEIQNCNEETLSAMEGQGMRLAL